MFSPCAALWLLAYLSLIFISAYGKAVCAVTESQSTFHLYKSQEFRRMNFDSLEATIEIVQIYFSSRRRNEDVFLKGIKRLLCTMITQSVYRLTWIWKRNLRKEHSKV